MTKPFIYDISVPLRPGMPVWDNEIDVKVDVLSTVPPDTAAVSHFSFGSHTGTHIDPPAHFIPNGARADQLPLDAMIGPCVVRRFDERYEITAEQLDAANIPEGTERLILATPGSELWTQDEFTFEYTGLSLTGAEWCVRHGIRLVGIDYLSIERNDSPTRFGTHVTLLSASIVIVEGLDMRGVPEGEYNLVCLPLKIQDGDGAPARAILMPLSS
jgi:arylformamidase